MPPKDHTDRRVEIYFGPESSTSLSKQDVADFLINDMGLVREDGAPKWTDGLTTLIKIGMNDWKDESVGSQHLDGQRFDEIIESIEECKNEIQNLNEDENNNQHLDAIQASKQVQRIKAKILEVLCREEKIGVKSPNL